MFDVVSVFAECHKPNTDFPRVQPINEILGREAL